MNQNIPIPATPANDTTTPPKEWHLMELVPPKLRQDARIAVDWLWTHHSTPSHFKTLKTFAGVVKKWVGITTSIKTWKFFANYVSKVGTSYVAASIKWSYTTFTSPSHEIPKPRKHVSFDQLRPVHSATYGTQPKSSRSDVLYDKTAFPTVDEKKGKSEEPATTILESSVEVFPSVPPFSLEQVHEISGHPLDCICTPCHLEDVQRGEIDCAGGETCAACRSGMELSRPG